MSLARRRKRRIVVGGSTWWHRANYSYDQLWTDGGGMLIVRDDRKVQVWLTAPGRGEVNRCLARVVAPVLPWFASRPKFTAYEVPVNVSPGWTPGVVAKVIAWCLDASAERVVAPSPWQTTPALPDERTVEGFVARLLNPPGRDLQRVVDVVEDVLDRPLIARPLDPVARDLLRSRRLIAHVWETLAVRGIIPNDWAGDSPRGFVASVERALEGEAVIELDGFDADCVAARAPLSVRCALALASDVEGVLRAESLARESLGRFEALCASVEQRDRALHWRALGDAYAGASVTGWGCLGSRARRAKNTVERAVRDALWAAGRQDELDDREVSAWPGDARGDLVSAGRIDRSCARRWALARELGLRLPGDGELARDAIGARLDELADPYAPLMDLWRSGYALDWRVSGLALAAPDVPFE